MGAGLLERVEWVLSRHTCKAAVRVSSGLMWKRTREGWWGSQTCSGDFHRPHNFLQGVPLW